MDINALYYLVIYMLGMYVAGELLARERSHWTLFAPLVIVALLSGAGGTWLLHPLPGTENQGGQWIMWYVIAGAVFSIGVTAFLAGRARTLNRRDAKAHEAAQLQDEEAA